MAPVQPQPLLWRAAITSRHTLWDGRSPAYPSISLPAKNMGADSKATEVTAACAVSVSASPRFT